MPDFDDTYTSPIITQEYDSDDEAIAKNEEARTAARPGWLGSSLAAAGLAVPDFVDQTVSSIPLLGVERGAINQRFLDAWGSPGLSRFAEENHGATELVSGIAGVLVADKIATKLLGFAAESQAFTKLPGIRNIAAMDNAYSKALRAAQQGTREVAARGEMNAASMSGVLEYRALGVPTKIDLGAARKNVVRIGTAKKVGEFAASEAVMLGTMNSNQLFYSDDWSENLAWMGVGLGVGGLLAHAVTTRRVRQLGTTKGVEAEQIAAYDANHFERSRQNVSLDDVTAKTWLGYGQETNSSILTSQMLHVAESRQPVTIPGNAERATRLQTNRSVFATALESEVKVTLNKITTGGVAGVGSTGFNDAHKAAFGAVHAGLVREPTLLYNASEVGVANPNLGIHATDAARANRIDDAQQRLSTILNQGGTVKLDKEGNRTIEPLTKEARIEIQQNLRKLWYQKSLVGFVQLIPGELAPIDLGRFVDHFVPRRVTQSTKVGKTIWEAEKVVGEKHRTIGVSNSGDIYLPQGANAANLNPHETIQLYHTLRKAADGIAKGSTVMTLPQKPTWIQLDLAEQVLRKTDNPGLVTFPNGMTREDAIVESFAQKVDAIRKDYKDIITPGNDLDAFWARVKFNLPQFTPAQSALFRTSETPIDTLLYSFKNGDEVRKLGYAGLKREIEAATKIQGLTDEIARPFNEMTGKSYDFLLDEAGDAIEPVIVYKRPTSPNDWTRDALDYQIANRKAFSRSALMAPTADPRIKAQTEALLGSPDFQQALRVEQLTDNQHVSILPGMTNKPAQSIWGAATDAFNVLGKAFRDREIPTLTSASRVKDLQDRIARGQMAQTFKEVMGDVANRVAAPRAGQTRVMLSQFYSQRQGWTIAEQLDETGKGLNKGAVVKVALPSGEEGFKFKLANNESNKARWESQFNSPMPKDAFLPNAQGVDMVVDSLGMEALDRFEELSNVMRGMQNTVLRAKGLSEINRQFYWVPSPETQGKYVAFAFDDQNKIIPGTAIVANTQEQLAARTSEATKESWFKPGYTIRSRDQVTSFMDLYDKAQMDWHDANNTAVASGKKGKGLLTGQHIDMKAFDRALGVMVNKFLDVSQDAFNHLTKDAINGAALRAEVGRSENAIGRGAEQYNGVFDRYIENITGKPARANKNGFLAPGMDWAESRINNFMRDLTPNSSKVYTMAADYLRMIPWAQSLGARENNQKLFEKLTHDLGPYMPFNKTTDLIEAQTGHAVPKEIKEISAKIGWFESTNMLRYLETMHGVMNFASIVHNIPSIIKGMQRLNGETEEQWFKRIGHVGSIWGQDKQVAVVNPAKLTFLAFKDAWNPKFDEFTTKAFERGFMDQEVSEIQRQFQVNKTPGLIRGWLFGDPNGSTKLARKGGLDHYLGYMSDASENYSRRVGMYAGRRVAELSGITKVDDQVAFAHSFTNDMIANYDPRNRPEIFQGWLGAPIGLFQSYVANYYGRMYKLLETENHKALASQAIWQTAVFGTQSFGPFWQGANKLFFDKGGVLTEDANESFEHRLGSTDADILMYGVVANLPKLFGGDGMSVYTRGDINVRLPVLNMPIASSAAKVWNGLTTAYDAWANNVDGLSSQQLAEIVSNSLDNRPLAGLIEQFGAGGYDTDAAGQVTAHSENLLSLDTAYRLMGVRSMQSQKDIAAFYADKEAGEHQTAAQTRLRLESRAQVRAGNLDALPDLFVKYVENGGDVKYYSRWYNDLMKSAKQTRSTRRLDELLKNGKKMASVNRLIDAGVTPTEEAEADDYGQEELIKQETKAKVDEMLSVYDLNQ